MLLQTLVAGYHGEPSMCTDAHGHPMACCIHGMATFPQWHRLYVTHFEQALVKHGLANIGVPYWDWTQPLTELPPLVQVGGLLRGLEHRFQEDTGKWRKLVAKSSVVPQ